MQESAKIMVIIFHIISLGLLVAEHFFVRNWLKKSEDEITVRKGR